MSKKKPKNYDRVKSAVINGKNDKITVDELAKKLDLTIGEVQHCFHFLNLEGILSQAIKPPGVILAQKLVKDGVDVDTRGPGEDTYEVRSRSERK